jgi:DNA polymerase/3'-5' exonuclease PolX
MMGGNALKNTKTRRYDKDEYLLAANYVRHVLLMSNDSRIVDIAPIQSYQEKETFGDLDILYSTIDDLNITLDQIKKLFSPNEIIKNGDVISFDYKELQVDLILSKKEVYEYASLIA